MRALRRQLAIAGAGLGRPSEAAALCDELIELARPLENPLELGASHRDRARIALLAGDRAAFAQHFNEMQRHYRRPETPASCSRATSLPLAQQAGLREPATKAQRNDLGRDSLQEQTYVELSSEMSTRSRGR